MLVAIHTEGLAVKGVFVANPTSSDRTAGDPLDNVDRGSQVLRRSRLDLLPEAGASKGERI